MDGACLIDSNTAFGTGLWHSRGNCNTAFRDVDALVSVFGQACDTCKVTINSRECVLLYKSTERLAQRIHEVTGFNVTRDVAYEPTLLECPQPTAQQKMDAEIDTKLRDMTREDNLNKRIKADHDGKLAHQAWKREQVILAKQSRQEFYANL